MDWHIKIRVKGNENYAKNQWDEGKWLVVARVLTAPVCTQ